MRKYVAAATLTLLPFVVTPSWCLDPKLALSQYVHTSWTQDAGIALPAVKAIAQTPDGYVWMGTTSGLMRFDGVRFWQWASPNGDKLPDSTILFLDTSVDGSLWLAGKSGVSRLDHGRLQRYDKLKIGEPIAGITESRAGQLWIFRVGAPSAIGSLDRDGSFQLYSAAEGIPPAQVNSIHEDRTAGFWIGTVRGLCKWSPRHPAACIPGTPPDVATIVEDHNGDLLVVDASTKSILRLHDGVLKPAYTKLANESLSVKTALRDHDGNIWFGTAGQGLMRLTAGKLDRFTKADGLSSDYIDALMEDREGNLWAGTARGLDQFRDPRLVRLSSSEGLSSDLISAVQAARDGAVWVGTLGGGLNRVVGNRATPYRLNSGLPSTSISSLYEDSTGRLWAATSGGLAYLSQDRFIPVNADDREPLSRVFAITEDPAGAIWVLDGRRGIMVVRDNVARPAPLPATGRTDYYRIAFDRSGTLWIGYFQGGLAAIHGDRVTRYDSKAGLAKGPVQDIAQDRSGAIWIGAGDGLSRFRHGAWTTWDTSHGVPEGGVQRIIEDDRGALWAVTFQGVSRLSLETLAASPDGAPKHLVFAPYGQNDGVRPASTRRSSTPRGTRSADGRLWICTDDGVAIVDPAQLRSNPLPPPVNIEQVVVDGRPLDIRAPGALGFQGRQLQIMYAGLSLTVPERVHFKYRLDGAGGNWIDAGSRRTVDFVNLAPGKYRFHVIASNNDDVWNSTGAALDFRVDPRFYQTTWFVGLCLTALALAAWGIHRVRVRAIVSRIQAVAQERTRLTRELHDSLLQGFVGVVYQLEATARQMETDPAAASKRLHSAIERADQSLTEARQTIMAMRLPALENSTLPEAISAIAKRLTEGTHIFFHMDVKGHVRQLPYNAQANLYLIGREAITNSVNHARPRRIEADITYSSRELRLLVRDDGDGFDLATAAAKQDHWGMVGMRERANQIGATLTVDSRPGRGTVIEVIVPQKKE